MDQVLFAAQQLLPALAAFKAAAQALEAGKSSADRLAGHLVEIERHVDQLVTDLRSVPGMLAHSTRAEISEQLEAARAARTLQETLARRLASRVEGAQEHAIHLQAKLERASEPPWKSARAAILEAQQEVHTLILVLRGETK